MENLQMLKNAKKPWDWKPFFYAAVTLLKSIKAEKSLPDRLKSTP